MDGMFRTRRSGRLPRWLRWWVCGLIAAAPAVVAAAPRLVISPFGYRIEQIAPVDGQARAYDLTLRAGVANPGDPAADVTARLSSSFDGVMVLDGQIGFGDVGRASLLRPAVSLDTFRLRLTLPRRSSLWVLLQYVQSALDGLSWTVSCANCGGNRPPVADAGPDRTAFVGQGVTLDGSGSFDADGQSLQFGWAAVSLPAGSAVSLSDAAAVQPTIVPDLEGVYVFRLIVSDGIDDSAPAIVTVTTRNSAPVARAGEDLTAAVGARVRLDGSTSSDADGDALTYEWTLLELPPGSDAMLLTADPASPWAEFIPDRAGRYVAELVVHDGQAESQPDTVLVSTVNSAPVADAGPDRTVAVGAVVQLDGYASTDVDGDALAYRWSLTVPEGSQAVLAVTAGVETQFVVDRPGLYLAQLIVNDGAADSVPDTAVISTVNSAPVADAGVDREVQIGEEAFLDGSASHDADDDPLGFDWSLTSVPPGSVAVLDEPQTRQPALTPDLPGAYVSQLIVNDGSLDSAPATVTLSAREPAPPPVPDTEPPAAPQAQLVSLVREGAGHIRVSGKAGSVEGRAQVTITNYTTGVFITATAAADGSFSVLIAAADADALLIVARDAAGNASGAAAISAGNDLELIIDTPLANTELPGSIVRVSGRLRAPRNSGVVVDGRPATVHFDPDGSTFVTQIEVAPPEGAGPVALPVSIDVSMHTPDGRSLTRQVDVLVRRRSDYVLRVSPANGPAPLRAGFELIDRRGAGVSRLDFDFDGDGQIDLSTADISASPDWTYTEPGSYLATVAITEEGGSIRTANVPVTVHDRDELLSSLRSVWDGMTTALVNGSVDGAAARLNESARRRYAPVFEVLREDMPQIVASFSPLHPVEVGSEIAEFVVARDTEGADRAFFIYMTRDRSGVWRVGGM